MRKNIEEITSRDLQGMFGSLSAEEMVQLKAEFKAEEDLDLSLDKEVDAILSQAAEAAEVKSVPSLPAEVRSRFEEARELTQKQVEAEELALEEKLVLKAPRPVVSREKSSSGWLTRWLPLAVGAAAAVAVLMTVNRGDERTPDVLAASEVTLLTPGEVTGFSEPVFTWDTDNGGVVDVAVFEKGDDRQVAFLASAFSPIAFSGMESEASLEKGRVYEVAVMSSEGTLATREFTIMEGARGAPKAESSLEGVIDQCRQLIADNRPADAWMLWGQLTVDQKGDPRMQELKEQILSVLKA